ncbi:hypothetical protein [Staphylococcus aureus]|nr:hypothetical protein [Staphylococcus aureus]
MILGVGRNRGVGIGGPIGMMEMCVELRVGLILLSCIFSVGCI